MCVRGSSVWIMLHLCVRSFDTFQPLIHQSMLCLGAGKKLAFKLIHVEFQSFPRHPLIRQYLMKYLYIESSDVIWL